LGRKGGSVIAKRGGDYFRKLAPGARLTAVADPAKNPNSASTMIMHFQ